MPIDLQRKIGPAPLYLLVVGAGVVGLVVYRFIKARNASSGGGTSPGQGTQFSSSTTSSGTDAAGNQISTNYSAQGNGFLPGMLTYGAGQMPVSGGDVYVNYPAQTTTPSPPQVGGDDNYDNPDAYGQREVQKIQTLVGQQGYTQAIVDDVHKAYDATAAKFGQAYADVQHYSYLGPGNVQVIPRHVTAVSQISTDVPSNPKWGTFAPQAFDKSPYPGSQNTPTAPNPQQPTPVVTPR